MYECCSFAWAPDMFSVQRETTNGYDVIIYTARTKTNAELMVCPYPRGMSGWMQTRNAQNVHAYTLTYTNTRDMLLSH